MKKSILAFIMLTSLSSLAIAQKKETIKVPIAVEKAFQKAHPNTKAKWEKENTSYEAEYKVNGTETRSLSRSARILEETEVEIAINRLPVTAAKYVSTHHLGEIKEASKIVKANGNVVYEAKVKSGDALFDAKGNFIELNKD